MPFISQAILLLLGGLLVAVAYEDIRSRLIPNRYCLAIVLLYPAYVFSAGSVDWIGGLMTGAIALVVGYVMFAFRLTGGGDAKLFAAMMLWAGPKLLALFLITMALFGGVLGIYFLIRRRRRRPAAASSGPVAPFPSRFRAAVAVFFGNMLLARAGGVGATASSSPHAPAIEAGELPSESPTKSAADYLPYGVAIAVGGLVVAATLLMKG